MHRDRLMKTLTMLLALGIIAGSAYAGMPFGETAPTGATPGPVAEAPRPSLAAAVSHAADLMLERDVALMDAPADAGVLLIKRRPGGEIRPSRAIADEIQDLDRAARLVADLLFQRGLQVTVIESPSAGGEERSVRALSPRTTWQMTVSRIGERRALMLRGRGQDGASVVVPYEEKPWVVDLSIAAPGHDSTTTLRFRGESGIRGDADEARAGALADGLAQIRDRILDRLAADDRSTALLGSAPVDRVLDRELSNPVLTNKFVKDWYLGESGRAYGTVYRGHVLLEVAADEFQRLEALVRRGMNEWHHTLWISIVGFLLSIPAAFALYLKLDARTKGYFSNWLRFAGVTGVGVLGTVLYLNLF